MIVSTAQGHLTKILVRFFLCVLPLVTALACLGFGRFHLSITETVDVLFSSLSAQPVSAMASSVIFNIRLPRILLSLCAGSALAISGASFQALFSNPLATPDTLGVASGASFGAVMALLFSHNLLVVQSSALIMGCLALCVTTTMGRTKQGNKIIMIILAGMVVSALFHALVSLVKYIADPDQQLPAITYWLMGSMARASAKNLTLGVPMILSSMGLLYALRWRLNILSLQEDEAKALGIPLKKLRIMVMAASTMTTASCVALCGQVGWIGLLIPHAARMLVGSDNTKIIPVAISLGATFTVIMDTVARSMTSAELPISVLTAVIGAPIFILLLRKTGGVRL